MTALTQSLSATLALAADARVAATLDASVPAIVLGGDGRTLRFLNSAASHVLSMSDARPALGKSAPLDEAVCKHLQRIAAGAVEGKQSTERVRYYRGIKPIILSLAIEHLGVIAGEPALLVTLPELARPTLDNSIQATLNLYGGPDDLITILGDDDVLAVAGRHAILDEAPGEIEALAERTTGGPVETTHVRTPDGQRPVLLVRLSGQPLARRLIYIGPLEPMPVVETTDVTGSAADHAPAVAQIEVEPQPIGAEPFVFTPQTKPERFAWEIDGSGRFVTVGPEFAARLGSAAAPRAGESWNDLASRLAVNPAGTIADLLHKRQPWHGQAVDWPVEGTALRVPVILTAMPLAGSGPENGGFRGFGVIRSGSAVADPLETGLHLGSEPEAVPDIAREPEPVQMLPAIAEAPVFPAPIETITPTEADIFEPAVVLPEPTSEQVSSPLPPLEPSLPKPEPALSEATNDEHFVTLMPPAHISPETLRLTGAERNAFRQIAEALGARFEGDDDLLAAGTAHDIAPTQDKSDSLVPIMSTRELLDELNRPAPHTVSVSVPVQLDRRRPPVGEGDTRLIDRLPIAIALTRDEAVIHVNATFLTLTGYDNLDDLNRAGGLDVLFAGPHAAGGWAEDRNRHHIPLVTRSGRVLPVDARIASVPWNGGTALLITLISQDRPGASIHDAAPIAMRETLAAAQERVRELEAILATASDGIVMLGANGHVVSANPSAEVLFGLDQARMTGMHLSDLMAPESQRAASAYIDGIARNGIGSLLLEGRELVGKAGSDRQIALFATITKVSTTPEPLFAAVFRDISRWKTSEEDLTLAKRRAEEASLQKSDFLAKISHEIRTPLNAIIGFSEVMLGERFGAIGVERYKDYLRDIQSSGTHIMSLVNDLLDLSKVESGKLDLKFESVQLTDILAECVQLMQPQASRERVIIRASLTQGLPPVVADHRSIRQIVLNLLSNAIKFTPAGGQVIVSAALEDSSEVVIRVRDTGYGMSANDIEIALEPFRQVHNARGRNSGPGSGTGLGLPLTKALVEANRAALKIDSAINQGTLVQVTFPAPRVLAAE
jgi:PAS domain S-box-containing protein